MLSSVGEGQSVFFGVALGVFSFAQPLPCLPGLYSYSPEENQQLSVALESNEGAC